MDMLRQAPGELTCSEPAEVLLFGGRERETLPSCERPRSKTTERTQAGNYCPPQLCWCWLSSVTHERDAQSRLPIVSPPALHSWGVRREAGWWRRFCQAWSRWKRRDPLCSVCSPGCSSGFFLSPAGTGTRWWVSGAVTRIPLPTGSSSRERRTA